jgi:hypothetical protein
LYPLAHDQSGDKEQTLAELGLFHGDWLQCKQSHFQTMNDPRSDALWEYSVLMAAGETCIDDAYQSSILSLLHMSDLSTAANQHWRRYNQRAGRTWSRSSSWQPYNGAKTGWLQLEAEPLRVEVNLHIDTVETLVHKIEAQLFDRWTDGGGNTKPQITLACLQHINQRCVSLVNRYLKHVPPGKLLRGLEPTRQLAISAEQIESQVALGGDVPTPDPGVYSADEGRFLTAWSLAEKLESTVREALDSARRSATAAEDTVVRVHDFEGPWNERCPCPTAHRGEFDHP